MKVKYGGFVKLDDTISLSDSKPIGKLLAEEYDKMICKDIVEVIRKYLPDTPLDHEKVMKLAKMILAKESTQESGWISVDERLPDNHRTVLVACEGTTIGGAAPIAIGSYGGGFWSIADADGTMYLTKYMHIVVTHWMPLPELPKMK